MIKSNRIEFTNSRLSMLSNAGKLYTSIEAFRVGSEQYRLKLRVRGYKKTFCIWHEGRRIQLGEFTKQFGVLEATALAMKIIGGDIALSAPKPKAESLKHFAEKVFEKKKAQGKKNVNQEIRAFRAVPDFILNKPIDKITREDVIEWKEEVMRSGKSWNHAVAIPNNIWNVASDNWAFSILENKRNPFSKTKEKWNRKEFSVPKFGELKELWKMANDYGHDILALVIKLKILTGMHFSEMQGLILEEVVECGEWLEINHKIGRKHKIYLSPKVRELLDEFIKLRNLAIPNSPLFTVDGSNPIGEATIQRHWKLALQSKGYDFQFSKIRHALVTEMEDTGFESKYITGHCYKENIQAKHYKNWDSDKMKDVFMKANTYWQERIYRSVNNHWF